jgi:deoxyribodipyrimidine photolyase-related protein
VLSHKVRIVYFLSAMRHFAEEVRAEGFRLEYRKLDAPDNLGALDLELRAAIGKFRPARLVVVEAGEHRVEQMPLRVSAECGVPLEVRPDTHFYCSRSEFAD